MISLSCTFVTSRNNAPIRRFPYRGTVYEVQTHKWRSLRHFSSRVRRTKKKRPVDFDSVNYEKDWRSWKEVCTYSINWQQITSWTLKLFTFLVEENTLIRIPTVYVNYRDKSCCNSLLKSIRMTRVYYYDGIYIYTFYLCIKINDLRFS